MSNPRKKSRFNDAAAPRLPPTHRPSSFQPPALFLNKDGQAVDATGQVVNIATGPVSTLRVNQQQHQQFASTVTHKRKVADPPADAAPVNPPPKRTKPNANPYLAHLQDIPEEDRVDALDPDLRTADKGHRATHGLKFVEQGTVLKRAKAIRAKEARKAYLAGEFRDARRHFKGIDGSEGKGRIKASASDDGDDDHPDGDTGAPGAAAASSSGFDLPPQLHGDEDPPVMEWWDVAFLPKAHREEALKSGKMATRYDLLSLKNKSTFKYVEHPIPIQSSVPKEPERPMQVYLTKKEQKRIRKRNREEIQKDQQMKVQVGLLPPPEPKVKISTMMNVLGKEAVADPSQVERMVQQQIKARQQNHEMRNQARKLTPAERKEKKHQKLLRDAQGIPFVAVFRVENLTDPPIQAAKRRYKIDVRAQSTMLTGCTLLVKDPVLDHKGKEVMCNCVVVEGGKKSIRSFVRLMLRRIDWSKTKDEEENSDSDDSDSDEDDKAAAGKHPCELVWYGQVANKAFSSFEFEECRTAARARTFLHGKGVAHYWDLCANFDEETHDRSIEHSLLS